MLVRPMKFAGVGGTLLCIGIFLIDPSWPTPDKLLVFFMFVFMIFGQATALLKRFVPFVGLLLTYEAFRSVVPSLNHRVEYRFMPAADKWLFGVLPTAKLQSWWWHGSVQWYDFAFYLFYMLHFILPFSLALLIWKKREPAYWQYVASYLAVSFAGFITFLAFPAAPPWIASQKGIIQPITRISSDVWSRLGIHDFPSVYNKISPNPVAAVPSLHAAYATLFALFTFRLFGKKWGLLSLVYPLMIYVGTVYQGEHYAIDEILGALYAIIFYVLIDKLFAWLKDRKNRVRVVALVEELEA
jgi:hypothetical protein